MRRDSFWTGGTLCPLVLVLSAPLLSAGDCNANGIPDEEDLASRTSVDSNENGVPDECDACPEPEPVECPGGELPVFRLGFRGPCRISGAPGSVVRFTVFGQIETPCLPGVCINGWYIMLATDACTMVDIDSDIQVRVQSGGFRSICGPTLLIDPEKNGGRTGGGSIAYVCSFDCLDGAAPQDIVRLTLEATIPESTEGVDCFVRYENDVVFGNRDSVFGNLVTYDGVSITPLRRELRIHLTPTSPAHQLPGDCNLDGSMDISDAICLLGHLFLGMPETLPCGNGSLLDPSNVSLLDANGDGTIDLSDPVRVLGFLFGAEPPPALGTECVTVANCPDSAAVCTP